MDQHLDWIHCIADSVFFDSPDRIPDGANRFALADRPAPEGWLRGEGDLWVGLEAPATEPPPAQGWKIHISVTMADAERCLDTVWAYCVGRGLSFKFLRSPDAMLILNAKYAGRASSGKLVTLYPADEQRFADALNELSALLAGVRGPYVLGDLRIGEGPLYVRYGAFAEMWCDGDGDEPVLAIRNQRGELVPDRRGPVFSVPDGIEVPDILRPHLDARRSASGDNLPYRVEEALHFSNGGGVYLARDSAGGQVVLREARPHAGLDRHRTDAVARLCREHAVLTRLAGLDCVPRVLDYRVVQEHHFLVEEYVEGTTLLRAVQTRSPGMYPYAFPQETTAEVDGYRDWATQVLERVEQALHAIHRRGVRFGDLHPANVLLRPDGRVVFIDFEFATDLSDGEPPGLGAPGFAAPDGVSGIDVDLYALACLRVFVFMMLTPLLDLDRSKALTLVDEACRSMAMPPEFGAALIDAQCPPPEATRYRPAPASSHERTAGATPPEPAAEASPRKPTNRATPPEPAAWRDEAAALFLPADGQFTADVWWPRIRDSLVAGIHASATPNRTDRLFPGSPAQFRTGGFDIAYGAAGVLLALHRVGAPVPPGYVAWLVRAVERAPARPCQGLYNGPHGVAAVLDLLGRRHEALGVLDLARGLDRMPASDTLHAGTAGRVLNLLHFAAVTGDDGLLAGALRDGERLGRAVADGTDRTPGHGLLRGPSGPALVFIRLYELTGEGRFLDLAWQALERDLDQGTTLADQTFQLRVGTRHLPYLDGGSGGVALVLGEYLRHRDDAGLRRILTGIRRSCAAPFVYQPGLFTGRAGLVVVLSRLGVAEDRPVLLEHVRRFAWHALLRDGHLAFPGEQLLRLSMDLATGSAGVLLALRSVFETGGGLLPHLEADHTTAVTR